MAGQVEEYLSQEDMWEQLQFPTSSSIVASYSSQFGALPGDSVGSAFLNSHQYPWRPARPVPMRRPVFQFLCFSPPQSPVVQRPNLSLCTVQGNSAFSVARPVCGVSSVGQASSSRDNNASSPTTDSRRDSGNESWFSSSPTPEITTIPVQPPSKFPRLVSLLQDENGFPSDHVSSSTSFTSTPARSENALHQQSFCGSLPLPKLFPDSHSMPSVAPYGQFAANISARSHADRPPQQPAQIVENFKSSTQIDTQQSLNHPPDGTSKNWLFPASPVQMQNFPFVVNPQYFWPRYISYLAERNDMLNSAHHSANSQPALPSVQDEVHDKKSPSSPPQTTIVTTRRRSAGRKNALKLADGRKAAVRQPASRSFICQTCGRAFGQPRSLSTHQLVHQDIRPHSCPHPGCTKSFRQSGHLQTHLLIHSGEKPFRCPIPGCPSLPFRHANRRCQFHRDRRLKKIIGVDKPLDLSCRLSVEKNIPRPESIHLMNIDSVFHDGSPVSFSNHGEPNEESSHVDGAISLLNFANSTGESLT